MHDLVLHLLAAPRREARGALRDDADAAVRVGALPIPATLPSSAATSPLCRTARSMVRRRWAQ